ncbi:flavoprotein [Pilobolus umbonatus]|nr:flavoprotein [Pilobolus umbonatus]
MTSHKKLNILIAGTGSVASIKIPTLVKLFQNRAEFKVKVAVTDASYFFIKDEKIDCEVYRDKDEWSDWNKVSDPILHIELRNWADIMLIAPLDANTMAKIANGLCDNLLTCILRAWDGNKPVFAAPAMNTHMWNHRLTSKHLVVLEDDLLFEIIHPISKKLACGDTGIGAMAEPETILKFIMDKIESNKTSIRLDTEESKHK